MATIETSVTTPPQTPLQAPTHGTTLTRSRSSPNKSVVSSPWHTAQRTMNSSVHTRSTYLDHEDFSNAIYVGNLEMTINNDALMKIFGRFGTIESVYRPPIHTDKADRTTHFAFIKYTDAESAQRAMQQADNILLGRRRLVVRPRIRSYVSRSINRVPSLSPQKSNQYPPLSYSYMPPQYYLPYNTHVNQNFMSKILSVFNLPYEMTPKDLFCLFSELGRVEGAFIYNVVDSRGRRVGEVAMGSFYHAKKALESLNNTTLNGYILELAFKPPTLSTQFIPPVNSGHSMMYVPPNSVYPSWQYSPSLYPVPNQVPMPWSYSHVPIDEAMANLSFYGEESNMMNSRRNSLASSVASGGGYAHVYDQQKANIDHAISMGVGGLPEGSVFYDPMTGLPIPMQACTTVNEMQDANIQTVTAYQPVSSGLKKTEATTKLTTPVTPVAPTVSMVSAAPVSVTSSASTVSAPTVSVVSGTSSASTVSAPTVSVVSGTSSASTVSVPTASVVSGTSAVSTVTEASATSSASTAFSASPVPSTSVASAAFSTSIASVASTASVVSVNTSQNTKTEPFQIATASSTTVSNSLNSSTSSSSFNNSSLSASIVPESQPIDPKNLYIKNLDDDIISHPSDIETLFKPFGTIVSSHLAVVPGTGISKGYGFVAFSKAEEAIKAKKSLDGSMVGRKRVFVSWAERRADREKRLKEIFKADNRTNIIQNELEKDVFKTQEPSVIKDDIKVSAVSTSEMKSTQKATENTTGMSSGTVITPNPMTVLSKWRGTPLSGIVEVEEPGVQVEITTPTEQITSEPEFRVYSEGVKSSQSMVTESETFEKNEIDKDTGQGQVCLRVRDENTSPKKVLNVNIKKKGGWYRKRWSSGWGGNYGNKKEDGDSPIKDTQGGESPIKDIILERIVDKENCESKSI
ncbi:hypothetical protein PNEG_01471 [Pneumocystis murina B123]|uniref:RRM domain-containing protein n=1 Tax=Pneumocystis murina (strain B123) TaxID=1069680 RepID=M7NNC9_PNEMU|nr:hypothetical protein PNEG_01471 [Pneumocystis murina B123]EMR10198.1 hypothetical protein PNEG_01471 [Pneumocystis murina B123]